jgi:uncharacterized protein (DUF4415 family)
VNPAKPTRPEYRDFAFATFTASSRDYARGLVVSVAADTIDALVADARLRGLDVREVERHDTRAQARIAGFRRRRTLGRPPLPRGTRRVAISIRIPPAVLQQIRARADADGVAYQSWIQRALVEKLAAIEGDRHVR